MNPCRGSLCFVLAAACAVAPPAPRPTGTGSIDVRIDGIEHGRGQVLVNVFVGPDGFPGDPARALRKERLPADAASLALSFDDLPAGEVAVAAFHDEDLDHELDRNLLGVPVERWGVSNGVRGFVGPPSFADSRVELPAGRRLVIAILLQ